MFLSRTISRSICKRLAFRCPDNTSASTFIRTKTTSGEGEGPNVDISNLDIRVSTISEAWRVENSEKLYGEFIDVGEESPRQIVSGLQPYYTLEDMQHQRCLVVVNLKKAKLAGVYSEGMVLCGQSDDRVEFVSPPADAPIGERIMCKGFEGPPMSPNQVKKKKVFENVALDLKLKDGVATYRGVPLMTSAGTCRTETPFDGCVT